MTKEQLDRINELAAIKKIRNLTPEEDAEREQLKTLYVGAFRESLVGTLESIRIVDKDGNKSVLKTKNNIK